MFSQAEYVRLQQFVRFQDNNQNSQVSLQEANEQSRRSLHLHDKVLSWLHHCGQEVKGSNNYHEATVYIRHGASTSDEDVFTVVSDDDVYTVVSDGSDDVYTVIDDEVLPSDEDY